MLIKDRLIGSSKDLSIDLPLSLSLSPPLSFPLSRETAGASTLPITRSHINWI